MVTLDSEPNGYRLTIIKNGRAMTERLSHADWKRLKASAASAISVRRRVFDYLKNGLRALNSNPANQTQVKY